jgi:threonine/homoserine/homoserine lactone efflux protein
MKEFVPFLGLISVLVAIPGPAVVLVMKNAVLRGRWSATTTALGVLTADVIWVAASVSGLTALLAASRPAFEALRILGSAYLVYLGARLLFSRRNYLERGGDQTTSTRPGTGRAFREGLLCDLSNPKTVLVFTSVIPQFLTPDGGLISLALLGGVFALAGFASLVVYAVVMGATHRIGGGSRFSRVALRSGGGILMAFGIGLAVEPVG